MVKNYEDLNLSELLQRWNLDERIPAPNLKFLIFSNLLSVNSFNLLFIFMICDFARIEFKIFNYLLLQFLYFLSHN